MTDLTESVKLRPKAHTYFTMAEIEVAKKNDATATAYYSLAIIFESTNAYYYTRRGEVYFRQGNTAKADADWAKAIQLDVMKLIPSESSVRKHS